MIDDKAIEQAGRTLALHAGSPSLVVLFGSRARGEARPDSDLDFLVIEEHVENKLDEMVLLRDALAGLDVPVDIVVVSREEAEDRGRRPGSLIRRALAEGQCWLSPEREQAELLLRQGGRRRLARQRGSQMGVW